MVMVGMRDSTYRPDG